MERRRKGMALRVGIIGLGRRWKRYRAALRGLESSLEVKAVCDQLAARAEAEARRLGCMACAGPVELLEREDVEGVVLLGGQWFGLWPLGQAARLGKPVLCAAALEEEALQQARAVGLPVLLAPSAALAVLPEQVGSWPAEGARLVRASWTGKGGDPLGARVVPLLLACAGVMGGAPAAVHATGASGAPAFAGLTLEFGEGRVAHLSLWVGPSHRPSCRLEVIGAE